MCDYTQVFGAVKIMTVMTDMINFNCNLKPVNYVLEK